jgi:plastocyanin domain-containing protein
VSDIQRESQVVLDSIKENDFHDASEVWKNDGITVYVTKEMAAKMKFLTQSRNFLIAQIVNTFHLNYDAEECMTFSSFLMVNI